MKKRERGGKARHPSVVAAHMQPGEDVRLCDEPANDRRVVPFWRAEQSHGPRPLGERAGEFTEFAHLAGGAQRKASSRCITSWSYAAGGAARPLTQSNRSASAHSSNAS